MRKPESAKGQAGVEVRLASVSMSANGVRPDALLRMGEGRPRGFWAREGRWFAHVGEIGRVEVDVPATDRTRFEEVWEVGRALLSGAWEDSRSGVTPPAPRLFGGFSFGDQPRPVSHWEAFPSACFLLPRVELMGVGKEGLGVLTLRRFVPIGTGEGEIRERLGEELEAVRESLTDAPQAEESGEAWIPATRGETDPAAWTAFVERALREVEEGTLSKVVLARVQTVSAEGTLDPVGVVLNLWKENPGSHVFLFEPAPGAPLLGAAPETVATVAEGSFRATAVAGSIDRGLTEKEQRDLAKALLGNQKDRREHQMCVQDTLERLGAVATHIQAQREPHVLTLSAIQHLETVIEARLRPEENVLSVLDTLHPTPAVCGLPRGRALEFLEREEPFQRGWYAGPVGWFDGEGNGVFVPALRSAVGCGGEWRLFAGAGIVAGSKPGQEWDETRIKFQPVLRALSGTMELAGTGGRGVENL